MMPCGPLMKPKLGFSIESLVGAKVSDDANSPPRSESPVGGGGRQSPPCSLSSVLSSGGQPLSFSDLRVPLATRALLALEEKCPIQRPQPINGAAHRVPSEAGVSIPPSLLKLPALQPHGGLLPPHLQLAGLPQFQGLPAALPPQLSPLMMGTGGLSAPLPREYPLYPWLLSRHGRVFPHGLPSKLSSYF